MITKQCASESGFTMIELIIGIVAASILGVVLIQISSTNLTESTTPIFRFQSQLGLLATMENVIADFENVHNPAGDLGPLKTAIGAEGSNQSNSYGTYTVVYNRYVIFDGSNNEVAGGTENLKVALQNSDGEIVTDLLKLY